VKGAYRVALELEHMRNHDTVSGNLACDGATEVCVFAWKVARQCLATQVNRRSRELVNSATCTICGNEEESVYHALLRCTKVRALRREMRQHWRLPEEPKINYTGPDWFLVLLPHLDEDQKKNVLLLLWRT
jgi:hypothetical protein